MPLIVTEARPHVVQVVIDNQPKRNAMSREMMAELAELWDRLDRDANCRAIVRDRGRQQGVLCAGADIGWRSVGVGRNRTRR